MTGGAGWFGHRLGLKLLSPSSPSAVEREQRLASSHKAVEARPAAGAFDEVLLLDIYAPPATVAMPPGMSFINVDVRDRQALAAAFAGAAAVFHVASFGM